VHTIDPKHGISTLVTHYNEFENPLNAHVTPIFQTSTFIFDDVAQGAAAFRGDEHAYIYGRLGNPNSDQTAGKIAMLEGLDLLRGRPETPPEQVVGGLLFSSGMAAITSAILGRVQGGQTVIAQESLYSATYNFLHDLAPQYGILVEWVKEPSQQAWEEAFTRHPEAVLAYAESPVNPTMRLVDLGAAAEVAHRFGAWLMVDNTFATPCCQRPLTLGADIVVHSTTKYLSGHGHVVGGCVVTTQMDYLCGGLYNRLKILGGNPGPFDAWLTNMGMKTLHLRMQRHCENALVVARFLEQHPAVERVNYPGLESFPQHELAKRQMFAPGGASAYGGMLSFELRGGFAAGAGLMDRVRLVNLAVSLGNLDSLISHSASMTHSNLTPEARAAMGISEGLVRLSVGVEDVADIIADLEQALK
jgi:methionine-gamma-lyase